jgi:GT2 family glycosyltransferase
VRIFAVVLNWKRASETVACVASLRATAPDVHVVVVDNASGDGSAERIRAECPGVTLIEHPVNAGYAGGNNAGIEAALREGADAVLVLNNDVIVRPGCVQTLASKLRDEPEWGIVAPLSLMRDDPAVVDFYRAEFDPRYLGVRAIGRDTRDKPTQDAETDYATGSALLMCAEMLREVGAFDERYFLVWEDVDLCLRARARGYKAGVATKAEVLHGRSVSFGGEGAPLYQYFYVRNSFLLMSKLPKPGFVSRAFKPGGARLLERRYRGWIETGDSANRRAIARGLEDGLAGRFGPAPADIAAGFDS